MWGVVKIIFSALRLAGNLCSNLKKITYSTLSATNIDGPVGHIDGPVVHNDVPRST